MMSVEQDAVNGAPEPQTIVTATTKPASKKRGNDAKYLIFAVLTLFTLGYFYFYLSLLAQTNGCTHRVDSGPASWMDWLSNFPKDFLSCRSVNELGDALAGAFAPVAFLWLAGAVFIQSQELAAQREELNETQEVMRQQLAVAREQVEETRESTARLKAETVILELQHQYRLADDEFDKLLFALRRKMQDEKFAWVQINGVEYEFAEEIEARGTDAEFFDSVFLWVDALPGCGRSDGKRDRIRLNEEVWTEVLKLLVSLVNTAKNCSPAYKRLSEVYHIEGLDKVVHYILDLLMKPE